MTRIFDSGSSRNSDENKLDYSGFNAPIVDWVYAQYMHKHRFLEDGTLRASDNWQKGIPRKELLKSLVRHVKDLELIEAGYQLTENGEEVSISDILCAIRFNTNAMILENVKEIKQIDRNYRTPTHLVTNYAKEQVKVLDKFVKYMGIVTKGKAFKNGKVKVKLFSKHFNK